MSENNIVNLPADEAVANADTQESANGEQNIEATTATTNEPVTETTVSESTPEPFPTSP